MHRTMVKLVIAAGLAAMTVPAIGQEVGDAKRGLAFARKVCAECHVVEPRISTPKQRSPNFNVIANTPGMTGTAIAVWLQSPHPSMPNFIIKEDDKYDLIAYILSLKTKL